MAGFKNMPSCMAVAATCLLSLTAGQVQPPTATVQQGVVSGTTTTLPGATGPVNKYLGVPFAAPPLRFAPPADPAPYPGGQLMATSYKPSCIQQFMYPEVRRNVTTGVFNSPPPVGGESEDCLHVNIFTPSTPAAPGGRTVMFWIYGGAFQFGSGDLNAYDGSAFAAYQDVVLVTHNYRTNVFGFPGAPELPVTQRNLGFLDQRLALQWVQSNIAAFGGDPKKVTIFGESAGSFSVDALLTSLTTETAPFRAAIMESGQISYYQAPIRASANGWDQLIKALNCGSTDALTCARAAPASQIKSIIELQAITFGTTPDNSTLYANAAQRRQAGDFAAVPILIGTNANEGNIFQLGQGDLDTYLQTTYGKLAPEVIPAFKSQLATGNGYDDISFANTLGTFQCGSALTANATVAKGVPAWRYYYNATFPNLSPFGGLIKVYHSSEISMVWQTYPGGPVNPTTSSPLTGDLPTGTKPTAQQYALGMYMQRSWADFAKNPAGGPGWPALGTFEGQDLAVIGTVDPFAMGLSSSGARIIGREVVDAPCNVILPAFKAGTPGPVIGLE